jgi:thiol-disulfide isomerase/thioredoxin
LPSDDGVQVTAELEMLGEEYNRIQGEYLRALPPDGAELSDPDLSDAEWMKLSQQQEEKFGDVDREMLPRFLRLGKSQPHTPSALDALAFVIRRGGPQTGNVKGEPWRLKEQAIDEVRDHHMDDPRMVYVIEQLSESLPSHKTESFLRTTLTMSPQRSTRAAAMLGLARYLHRLEKLHQRSRQLKDKPRPLNYERFWRIVITPYLEKGFLYDRDKTMAEVESLLTQINETYADVPATDWTTTGTSGVFFRVKAFPHPKVYGDLAKAMWFELNAIAPGKKAPDIEGVDADDKRFRLSTYRGKVVLLTFSANWCGGCVELYPLERELVKKYRDQPFALLSVSQDERVDTLKTSIASGEITWRCWWDGIDGPIRNTWNCRGVPGIILLDHEHVVQETLLNRFSTREEFEAAIDKLLSKVSAATTSSP